MMFNLILVHMCACAHVYRVAGNVLEPTCKICSAAKSYNTSQFIVFRRNFIDLFYIDVYGYSITKFSQDKVRNRVCI